MSNYLVLLSSAPNWQWYRNVKLRIDLLQACYQQTAYYKQNIYSINDWSTSREQ